MMKKKLFARPAARIALLAVAVGGGAMAMVAVSDTTSMHAPAARASTAATDSVAQNARHWADGMGALAHENAGSNLYVSSYGKVGSQPGVPELRLPIEVLGDGAQPMVEGVRLNLADNDIKDVKYLGFTCHRCAFFTAPEWEATNRPPTRIKASVRIVGAATDANQQGAQWVDLTDDNPAVMLLPAERLQGGLSVSGPYTARIRIVLDAATRARLTGDPSGNLIQFRFNGTDGESNGYRIINLDFRKFDGYHLATNPVRWDDIGAQKAQGRSGDDVAAGAALWQQGGLLAKSSIVTRKINASCASCHAERGRDLQYFNYSDNAIVQRSRFHGLSETQGRQIVAYVRSSNPDVKHVAQATPWNPPYQPGPGLDSKDIKEWAAGAGLDMVLDDPISVANALVGEDPRGNQVNIDQGMIDRLMDPNNVHNTRETAISLQFPDWNSWLPSISPEDVWPDNPPVQTADMRGSFNQGRWSSADYENRSDGRHYYTRHPKRDVQELDRKLDRLKSGTWGDWSHLTVSERKGLEFDMFRLGWEAWRFIGGGRSFKMAQNHGLEGRYAGEVGADNLCAYKASPTMCSRNDENELRNPGTNYYSFLERSVLAMMQWQIVQQWNLVQKYGLEGRQDWFISTIRSEGNPEDFEGIGESRGWALNTPGVFFVAPHMVFQESRADESGRLRPMVYQWEDAKHPVGSYYRSNIWYDLAMVLNPGGQKRLSNYPIDWPYHMLFTRMLAEAVDKAPVSSEEELVEAKALAATHMLREVQVKAKQGQQGHNYIPITNNDGRLETLEYLIPAKWLVASNPNDRAFLQGVNVVQGNLYTLLLNGSLFQFNRQFGTDVVPPNAWRRCDPNSADLTQGWQCIDKVRPATPRELPWAHTPGQALVYSVQRAYDLGADSGRATTFNDWANIVWSPEATGNNQ